MTDSTTPFWQRYRPATYVAPAAEATATNYGFAVSFPVIWVKNRIKMTPLIGFFWKDFAADGFDLNPAAGAKILYYLRKQPFGHTSTNSFYAGAGGMGTVNDFLDSAINQRSWGGAVLGYNYVLNATTIIAPEFRLGVNENGDFLPGAALLIHFGR